MDLITLIGILSESLLSGCIFGTVIVLIIGIIAIVSKADAIRKVASSIGFLVFLLWLGQIGCSVYYLWTGIK